MTGGFVVGGTIVVVLVIVIIMNDVELLTDEVVFLVLVELELVRVLVLVTYSIMFKIRNLDSASGLAYSNVHS